MDLNPGNVGSSPSSYSMGDFELPLAYSHFPSNNRDLSQELMQKEEGKENKPAKNLNTNTSKFMCLDWKQVNTNSENWALN